MWLKLYIQIISHGWRIGVPPRKIAHTYKNAQTFPCKTLHESVEMTHNLLRKYCCLHLSTKETLMKGGSKFFQNIDTHP